MLPHADSYLPRSNDRELLYSVYAVKIFNATSSLVRFENKNAFFGFKNVLA
jgi:hypothetical protein